MKNDINEKNKWSPENRAVLDTSDWEVACIGGAGGGAGLGASSLFFAFRSPSLRQYLKFSFVGGGVGIGLFGGWDSPQVVEFNCSRASWKPMKAAIIQPFSTSNLCNSSGRVTVASIATPGKVGGGVTGYTLTAIYDGPRKQGALFDKFDFQEFGVGPGGLGGGVFWGKWVFLGIPTGMEMNNNWTLPVCS